MRQKGRVEEGRFLVHLAIEGAMMGQKFRRVKESAEQVVSEIRRDPTAIFCGGEDPHRSAPSSRQG
jgi:hypothetical protein